MSSTTVSPDPVPESVSSKPSAAASPLIDVRGLDVVYRTGGREIHAVQGIDFSLAPGQMLGMAGESGSGKSTLALSLLRLLPPTATARGEVLFQGENLLTAQWSKLRAVRWAKASVVFQGAMSALNPVQPIGDQISEPILLHEKVGQREVNARVVQLLESVGVSARQVASYPHELSGGQRQRVMIAMALACRPDLIVADEPTTALDVIVQAQILSLIADLVQERQISLIMISHDLSVLAETCDRLAVMYAGRLVEVGPSRELIDEPRHPYTRALSRAFPVIGDRASRLAPTGLPGDPPDLSVETTGCPLAPRCVEAMDVCTHRETALWPAGPNRQSACLKVLPEFEDQLGSAGGRPT